MTTPEETALSMSRLTIGESNSSGSCYETAESDQSGPTQLESNDDEMGVFSCVELSGKDRDVIEDKAGETNGAKRRLHQTSITDYFPQRKGSRRTINLKTASGQRNHVRDNNDADTHTVNLNVAKNMGIICIGNNININITYCDGLSEQHAGGHCSDSPSQ